MVAKLKRRDDFKVLRDEATKIVDDLSHLRKVMAEVGHEKSAEFKENVDDFLEKELGSLKQRLGELSDKIGEHAKTADRHVHDNPYPYILGSLGLGYLLGKIGAPRSND